MTTIADYAVAPTGAQLDSFNTEMAKYGGLQPAIVVDGDSRANQETSTWLPGGGAPADTDLGINGDTIGNFDWTMMNSTVDLSQAHAYIAEIGINSARFVPGETEQDMLKATMAGLKFVDGKLAAGGHVYFNECYLEVGDSYGVNAMVAAYNADMAAKAAASGGWLVFVSIDDQLTDADYRPGDPTHLAASGNAKVIAADTAALIAHGDLSGSLHAPAEIITVTPDFLI